jgi:RNA polymerase sigma factor (sigma-70 family)
MNDHAATEQLLTPLSDAAFKDKLSGVIPHLRAFARGLCSNVDLADDLVQETMLKAWGARTRFQPGTNFKAWTFTILRNHYFSQVRRRRFIGEWDDLTADRLLAAPAAQDKVVEFRDMLRALEQLPIAQREALILVSAANLSYEETAGITGVAVGTVKSRVGRARVALVSILASGQLAVSRQEARNEGDPIGNVLIYIEAIKRRHMARQQQDMTALRLAA